MVASSVARRYMHANEMIKAIVDKHEDVYGGDSLYNNAIARMAAVDLGDITESDVISIVERFLYEWGRMGRVLGRREYSGWQGKVAEIARADANNLKRFQKRTIENEDLDGHKVEIARLYETFRGTTGPIASAKILNLTCPDFFPLWDNAIADAVRVELADTKSHVFDKSVKVFSGEDYFRFMVGIKLFMVKHADMISSLSRQYEQKKLRIVDECLWSLARRPFYLIF
jgi:hypothetical protein